MVQISQIVCNIDIINFFYILFTPSVPKIGYIFLVNYLSHFIKFFDLIMRGPLVDLKPSPVDSNMNIVKPEVHDDDTTKYFSHFRRI